MYDKLKQYHFLKLDSILLIYIYNFDKQVLCKEIMNNFNLILNFHLFFNMKYKLNTMKKLFIKNMLFVMLILIRLIVSPFMK